MKKIISVVVMICLVVSVTSLGYAQTAPKKLGRGIVNTVTGFWEVPLNMIRMSKEEGMAKGLSVGLIKGTWLGLYRTGVGLYEVLTFIIPMPADFEPITDPDILLTAETLSGDPSMRGDFRPLEGELSGGRRGYK
jgi:putative exosortase-associated protein (TIGR04073 family)